MTDDIKALADPEGIDWPASFEMQKARAERAEQAARTNAAEADAALKSLKKAERKIRRVEDTKAYVQIKAVIERAEKAEQERDAYAAQLARILDTANDPNERSSVLLAVIRGIIAEDNTDALDWLAARDRRVAARPVG